MVSVFQAESSIDISVGYFWANAIVSLFYAIASVHFLRLIAIKKQLTTSNILTDILYAILAIAFALRAALIREWGPAHSEIPLILVSMFPAVLLFHFDKKNSAERFNDLKNEFLTVASHELRTPLSVINGFAEILVREKLGKVNDEQKRRLRKILMQGQRLNRIIDELLDLSRIRSGKIEVKKDVFAIVPVLKVCLEDQKVVCEQQNITLIDDVPDVLPDVVGDIERVTQVVVNLLGNAVKYTPGGGEVTLSVKVENAKKRILISIKDTGIGIDPSEQGQVFQEFYRSTDMQARKHSGSGLGLAIVKQLVEAQGGTVGVTSQGQGSGSTFFFSLPTAKKAIPTE